MCELFVCLFVYVCLFVCLCLLLVVSVCVYVCVYVRACMHACLYLYLYLFVFVFVYIYAFLSQMKNGFPDFTISPYLLRTLIVKFVVVVVVVVVVITFRLFLASQEEPKVIDTKELKVCRKRVRPLSSQTEMESRRLWQNVTAALKSKDIDSATAAKHLVSRSSKSLLVDSCRRALGDQTRTV